MKCVVVGGGVIGASVTWHLAQRPGVEVVLVERDQLASGTTWHSAGNITWKPIPDHDASVLYAYDTIKRLEAESGTQTGWIRTGRMFLGNMDTTLAVFDDFNRIAQERDLPARWLTSAEAMELNPMLNAGSTRGIWLNPLSGRLNPSDLTQAYARSAKRAGALVAERVTVDGLIVAGNRIVGVDTSQGRLDADHVVVATGLWSRKLLEPYAAALAQWPCEHFYIIAEMSRRLDRMMPSFVSPDDLLYGREEVGRFLLGCFDEGARTLDPATLPEPFTFTLLEPIWDKLEPYLERAFEIFPDLATAPIHQFVNGPEAFTPDGLPLIGPLSGLEGLTVVTGMNSIGVTLSAMAGEIVASHVSEQESRFDIGRYAPERFGANSADVDWLKTQVSDVVSDGYRRQSGVGLTPEHA